MDSPKVQKPQNEIPKPLLVSSKTETELRNDESTIFNPYGTSLNGSPPPQDNKSNRSRHHRFKSI